MELELEDAGGAWSLALQTNFSASLASDRAHGSAWKQKPPYSELVPGQFSEAFPDH